MTLPSQWLNFSAGLPGHAPVGQSARAMVTGDQEQMRSPEFKQLLSQVIQQVKGLSAGQETASDALSEALQALQLMLNGEAAGEFVPSGAGLPVSGNVLPVLLQSAEGGGESTGLPQSLEQYNQSLLNGDPKLTGELPAVAVSPPLLKGQEVTSVPGGLANSAVDQDFLLDPSRVALSQKPMAVEENAEAIMMSSVVRGRDAQVVSAATIAQRLLLGTQVLGGLDGKNNELLVAQSSGSAEKAALDLNSFGSFSGLSLATGPRAAAGTQPIPQAISVPVGQDGFDSEIANRIVWMVKNDVPEVQIKLNPAQLGPIEVRVTMNNDQANVVMTAHHAMTRDALENALPRLREMFGDAGIGLANADVSSQSSSDQSAKHQEMNQGFNYSGGQTDGENGGDTIPSPDNRLAAWPAGDRVIDYFA